ncbi:hypothetical protein DK867_12570 [Ochrobactrum sp. POC9]|nr:hypothetical protein DK867_12570 [Ochrobactrum sp. POC9]
MKTIASDRRVPALLSNAYDSHIGAHLVQNKVVQQFSSQQPNLAFALPAQGRSTGIVPERLVA